MLEGNTKARVTPLTHLVQPDLPALQEVVQAAGRGNHDVHAVLHVTQLWPLGSTTVHTPVDTRVQQSGREAASARLKQTSTSEMTLVQDRCWGVGQEQVTKILLPVTVLCGCKSAAAALMTLVLPVCPRSAAAANRPPLPTIQCPSSPVPAPPGPAATRVATHTRQLCGRCAGN